LGLFTGKGESISPSRAIIEVQGFPRGMERVKRWGANYKAVFL